MVKVARRTIDALKLAPSRDRLLWDNELPGFGARCRPSGARSYFLNCRPQGAHQRWLTLGLHGALTPEQARPKALREKAGTGEGDEPLGERHTERREATVSAVADR